jgi:hypothetical protein
MIIKENQLELIRQIESAFADVKYPPSDKLVKDPFHWESLIVPRLLANKRWENISPEEIFKLRFNLIHFTPEAFCCYLPAYLVAYLNNSFPDVIDSIVYNLGSCRFSVDSIQELVDSFKIEIDVVKESEDRIQEFAARLKTFTPQQIKAIKAFIKDFMETETHLSPDNKIMGQFWEDYQG